MYTRTQNHILIRQTNDAHKITYLFAKTHTYTKMHAHADKRINNQKKMHTHIQNIDRKPTHIHKTHTQKKKTHTKTYTRKHTPKTHIDIPKNMTGTPTIA